MPDRRLPDAQANAAAPNGAATRPVPPRLPASNGVHPTVLLYDWDNTLVDGWAAVAAALNAVFAAFAMPFWTVEDTRARARLSLRESFPVMFGDRLGPRARHVLRHLPQPAPGPRPPDARRRRGTGRRSSMAAGRGVQQGRQLPA